MEAGSSALPGSREVVDGAVDGAEAWVVVENGAGELDGVSCTFCDGTGFCSKMDGGNGLSGSKGWVVFGRYGKVPEGTVFGTIGCGCDAGVCADSGRFCTFSAGFAKGTVLDSGGIALRERLFDADCGAGETYGKGVKRTVLLELLTDTAVSMKRNESWWAAAGLKEG